MVDAGPGDDDGGGISTELADEVTALSRGVRNEEVDAGGDALLGAESAGDSSAVSESRFFTAPIVCMLAMIVGRGPPRVRTERRAASAEIQ